MKYLHFSDLDNMSDCVTIYVNRNALNKTIAAYEIHIKELNCQQELEVLLNIWQEIYQQEKNSKKVETYIKMSNKDVKKIFKNNSNLPFGSFSLQN